MHPRPRLPRFQIGASLVPPIALAWMAARAGWLPVPPAWLLAAMPAALALGMCFPKPFRGWHRGVQRVQSALGRALLSGLLAAVFLLMVVPIGLILRAAGRSFLGTAHADSFWSRVRPPGSLRDPF